MVTMYKALGQYRRALTQSTPAAGRKFESCWEFTRKSTVYRRGKVGRDVADEVFYGKASGHGVKVCTFVAGIVL